MKRLIFSLLLNLIILNSFSQKFNISCERGNIVYIGFQNPLSVLVNGYSCDSISLKTKNGFFEKKGCYYLYYPDSVEDTKLDVYVIKNKKQRKIGEKFLRVRSLPLPEARIGGLNGGDIRRGQFLAQTGVGCYHSMPIDVYYQVKSFVTIIIRGGKILFQGSNEGNSFMPEVQSNFQLLQINDKVAFINILIKGPDGKEEYVKPIEFKIL